MNLTTTRQQRQQQRLERVWQQVAVQIPTARPQVPWPVLLGAGVVLGLGVGHLHSWLIRPIAPEPVVEQRCRFYLPRLTAAQLEPVMTPAQIAEMQRHLGPQLPKPAPPAQPTQAPGGDDRCTR